MYDYVKIDIPPVHKIQTLTELYEFCRNEFEREWRNIAYEIFNINSHHLRFPEGGVHTCTHMTDIEGMFPGEATFTWKDPTHAVCYIEIEITRTPIHATNCLIKIPNSKIVITLEFENNDFVHYDRSILNHETGRIITAQERENAQRASSEYIVKHQEFTWTYYRMIDDNVLHCRTVEVADDKLDKLMNRWDRILHMPADSISKMYDKGYEVVHNDH